MSTIKASIPATTSVESPGARIVSTLLPARHHLSHQLTVNFFTF
jgi:hypothetical protein